MLYHKWMDELRGVATLSVIVLHVSSYFVANNTLGSGNWWVGNFYESITRFSVPIFFMLSGLLALEGGKLNTTEFVGKKVKRILLPFVFWSFVFTIITVLKSLFFDKELMLFELLVNFVAGDAYYHLWFLHTLFIICLLSPFLQKVYRYSPNKSFKLALLAIVAFNGIEIVLGLKGKEIQHLNPILLPFFYIPYYIVGAGLASVRFTQGNVLISVATIIFLSIIIMLSARFFSVPFAYSYLSLPVALFAVVAFLFYANKKTSVFQFFKRFSPYYFGVYLLHPLIIETTYFLGAMGLPFGKNAFNPLLYIPIVSIFVFIFSLCGSLLLSKSKRLKTTIGL